MLGDLAKARESCQHSLALARKSGNKHMIVADLFYLGNIAKLEGKLDDARKTFSDSLPLAREAGGSALTALFEEGLAEVADEQNQREEARRQINELLSSLHEHKDPTNEIGAESLLARIALERRGHSGSHSGDRCSSISASPEPGVGGAFSVWDRRCPRSGGGRQTRRGPTVFEHCRCTNLRTRKHPLRVGGPPRVVRSGDQDGSNRGPRPREDSRGTGKIQGFRIDRAQGGRCWSLRPELACPPKQKIRAGARLYS